MKRERECVFRERGRGRERERERETDRQTDRQTDRGSEREGKGEREREGRDKLGVSGYATFIARICDSVTF